MEDVESIVARALAEFSRAADPAALENAKARYLGRSGEVTALLKGLGALAPGERRGAGARVNAAKEQLERALEQRRGELAGGGARGAPRPGPGRRPPPALTPPPQTTPKPPPRAGLTPPSAPSKGARGARRSCCARTPARCRCATRA